MGLLVGVLVISVFFGLFMLEKKNDEKIKAAEKRYLAKMKKQKKKKKDSSIVLPNPAMLLVYAIGIVWFGSVIYGLGQLANVVGPIWFLIILYAIFSVNSKKSEND